MSFAFESCTFASPDLMSFYIPVLGKLTQFQLSEILQTNFGNVKRIDITSKGVFAHFTNWHDNIWADNVWSWILTTGSYKYNYNEKDYLILRKMTCVPIPETTMNIHQVAKQIELHASKILNLEYKVAEQAEIIEDFQFWRRPVQIISDAEMSAMVDSLVSPRFDDDEAEEYGVCIYPEV